MPNNFIPICVSLNDKNCLIVGGGNVALRKVDTLLQYNCSITVVAEESHESISYYAKKNKIKLEKRSYKSPEASSFDIVISTSDKKDLNELVCSDAKKGNALVNVVDNPSLCDFIFPAVIKRDCLTASISTDGNAPFLSGHLKIILENIFPKHWTQIAKNATAFRKMVFEKWPDNQEKKIKSFSNFLENDWKAFLEKKTNQDENENELKRLLEE